MTSEPALFRADPAGPLFVKAMSTGMVVTFLLPLPDLHSPKAMVLLLPSVTSRRPIAGPVTWNMPLGGPPARCGGATHSIPEP